MSDGLPSPKRRPGSAAVVLACAALVGIGAVAALRVLPGRMHDNSTVAEFAARSLIVEVDRLALAVPPPPDDPGDIYVAARAAGILAIADRPRETSKAVEGVEHRLKGLQANIRSSAVPPNYIIFELIQLDSASPFLDEAELNELRAAFVGWLDQSSSSVADPSIFAATDHFVGQYVVERLESGSVEESWERWKLAHPLTCDNASLATPVGLLASLVRLGEEHLCPSTLLSDSQNHVLGHLRDVSSAEEWSAETCALLEVAAALSSGDAVAASRHEVRSIVARASEQYDPSLSFDVDVCSGSLLAAAAEVDWSISLPDLAVEVLLSAALDGSFSQTVSISDDVAGAMAFASDLSRADVELILANYQASGRPDPSPYLTWRAGVLDLSEAGAVADIDVRRFPLSSYALLRDAGNDFDCGSVASLGSGLDVSASSGDPFALALMAERTRVETTACGMPRPDLAGLAHAARSNLRVGNLTAVWSAAVALCSADLGDDQDRSMVSDTAQRVLAGLPDSRVTSLTAEDWFISVDLEKVRRACE